MFQIFNATKYNYNLDRLSGEFVNARSVERANALICDRNTFRDAFDKLKSTGKLYAVCFTDRPSEDVVNEISKSGAVVFMLYRTGIDALNMLIDYLKNGNVADALNFTDLELGNVHEGRYRLAFFLHDSYNPISQVMEIMSDSGIFVNKVATSRREDAISYVLAEVTNINEDKIIPQGELGSNLISIRKIE